MSSGRSKQGGEPTDAQGHRVPFAQQQQQQHPVMKRKRKLSNNTTMAARAGDVASGGGIGRGRKAMLQNTQGGSGSVPVTKRRMKKKEMTEDQEPMEEREKMRQKKKMRTCEARRDEQGFAHFVACMTTELNKTTKTYTGEEVISYADGAWSKLSSLERKAFIEAADRKQRALEAKQRMKKTVLATGSNKAVLRNAAGNNAEMTKAVAGKNKRARRE